MGCFLGCFGSKKEKRRRHRQAKRVQPKDQRNDGGKGDVSQRLVIERASEGVASPPTICLNKVLQEIVPDEPFEAVTPNEESREKLDEQLSFGARKKVTFALNVETYENTNDASEDEKDMGDEEDAEVQKDILNSSAENDLKSYPSNHRYQNCSNSDDEYEVESGESEIEDDDDDYFEDEDEGGGDRGRIVQPESSDSFFSLPSAVHQKGSESPMAEKEVNSPVPIEPKSNRDRSQYVHSVLNPIENLTQWKTVKMRSKPPLMPQKEQKTGIERGVQLPFSVEPSFKFSTYSSSPKTNHSGSPNEDITVDTSLSNWLSSSEKTPSTKTSNLTIGTESAEVTTKSLVASSPRSHEDRPILGALTVEEIRQYSANSSPRKSPSRSPDDMPILGTVGSYWRHTGQAMDSSSDSSNYKGIPNTTSKYREDMLVNWHATPFEKRLERALTTGEPEAYSCE